MAGQLGRTNFGAFTAGGIGRPASGMLSVGRFGWTKRTTEKKAKKQLNYNEREISSQILRASKYRNAAEVLTRAKAKVSLLKRCHAAGEYDEREIQAALNHAQKMVRCAKMKSMHLREEEREDTKNERAETKRRRPSVDEKERELRQLRQRHRLKERRKITEANMEYLKEKRENDRKSGNDVCATLDLSAAAMQLNQLEMESRQLEQEIALQEQELAADAASMAITADGVSISVTQQDAVSADTASAGAAPVSVDTAV